MKWTDCVIDATYYQDGLFCFNPIEGDIDGEFQVVAIDYIAAEPPHGMTVRAVIHEDGQEAAEAFYAEHKERLHELFGGVDGTQ